MNAEKNDNQHQNEDMKVIDLTNTFIGKLLGGIIKFLVTGGIFKLVAILFAIVGGICFFIEYKIASDYVKTTAIFEEYSSCEGDLCKGKYSFEVDGEIYFVSSSSLSDSFPEQDNVYYNPSNPEENMMYSNWHWLFITGILIYIGIVLYNKFTLGLLIKKRKKGDITIDNEENKKIEIN